MRRKEGSAGLERYAVQARTEARGSQTATGPASAAHILWEARKARLPDTLHTSLRCFQRATGDATASATRQRLGDRSGYDWHFPDCQALPGEGSIGHCGFAWLFLPLELHSAPESCVTPRPLPRTPSPP
ncbi:hypothetical protein V5799_019044 [Amblyomma americanum]|uniref:Uncharacterized protein n=1 Tax=Amblyomma americanum TaxID=6943 RepID=A0AAQ4EXZ1_AMBAM